MKIGLDISQTAHPGGVAKYTQKLAEGLEKSSDLEVTFLYSSFRKRYQGALKNVKQFLIPPSILELMLNKHHQIPIERFIGEVDIYHSSDWIQPKTNAKKVTTYHDLVPIKYPKWSHQKIVSVHTRRLKNVEAEIDLVIAVSEATKKDLLEVSQIPEEKIVVIYEGVDPIFKKQNEKDVEDFKKKYNLPAEFILAIGGVGERRNMEAINEASQGFNLIITGKNLPFIEESELPLLYDAASLLLYPSFYEGFGFPILEAQACETPVITSNVSSMPEIAGDGAILVDPNDLEQITKAVKNAMSDQSLRKDLIAKGLKNCAKFTWEKCIDQTVEAYKSLLK